MQIDLEEGLDRDREPAKVLRRTSAKQPQKNMITLREHKVEGTVSSPCRHKNGPDGRSFGASLPS